MKNYSVWDYIAWIVLILIGIWVFLKMIGVIGSPLWLEYSPLLGVVYLAGWAMNKLDRAIEDIKDVRGEIGDVKEEVRDIELDVNVIRRKCPELNK